MQRPHGSISLRKKILFSLLVFAVFFYGLDRISRVLVQRWQLPYDGRNVFPGTVIQNARRPFAVPDPARIWRLRPGSQDRGRDIFINSAGFRGDELRADASHRLVMLGDSCVFGWGVGHGETIAVRLSQRLAEKGLDVEVINAGVPGYSSLQVLEQLREILQSQQPDVITVQVGWNDAWATPSLSDREIVARGARLVSLDFRLRKLWVVRLSAYALSRHYYEKFEDKASGEGKRRVSVAEYRENLGEIVRLARENGVRPVVVNLPQRQPVGMPASEEYLRVLPAVADSMGAPLVDLVAPLQSDLADNRHLFLDDLHFSVEGSRAAAAVIAEELLADSVFGEVNQAAR